MNYMGHMTLGLRLVAVVAGIFGAVWLANYRADRPASDPVSDTSAPAVETRLRLTAGELAAVEALLTIRPQMQNPDSDSNSPGWDDADWDVLNRRMAWADGAGLDTLPFGSAVAAMGRTFVGWTYTPRTLEPDGPEGVVVNLVEFDCVTFVENVIALVRLHRTGTAGQLLEGGDRTRAAYEALLTELRYRGGVLNGYPSRLHYFSEWLSDNAARGGLELRTAELGGVVDPEPIDFMSTHPDAYRQLSDPAVLQAIRDTEADLNARERSYIPQDAIGAIADEIREGDVIAATSTVAGLDIAHTGIAVRVDGALHLMHAPLVGSVVEISELPLAERILGIRGQDGIMVATPLPGTR